MAKFFLTVFQSTSSFTLNCHHVPVLFAVLAAVAVTFPHRRPLPDVSFPLVFVHHCLPGKMPAKMKVKISKKPSPAAVVSSPTPTPFPDFSEPEEPETEGMFPDPLDPSSSQADQPILPTLPSSLPSSQPHVALSCEQCASREPRKKS